MLTGCGASVVRSTCTARERGTQTFFVTHFVGTANQVAEDCIGAIAASDGFRVVADNAYEDETRMCQGDGVAIYAKRRDDATITACDVFVPSTEPEVTVVLLSTVEPRQPFYVTIHGPRSLVDGSVRAFPPPKQIVQRPRGTKACQSHGTDLTITAYSPSKNAAANFCSAIPGRK